MAEIIAVCATSHSPGLTGWLDVEPNGIPFRDGMLTLRDRLAAAKPDVILGIANDHLMTHAPDDMPDFAVGIAMRHSGPVTGIDEWLKLAPFDVAGAPPLATAILTSLQAAEFDARAAERTLFDDNFSVPLHFLNPNMQTPFVPLLVNCLVPPMPDPETCYAAGLAVKRAIEAVPGALRVAVVATGGLSHQPGGVPTFDVDEAFDRWFLSRLTDDLPHQQILRECTIDRMEEAGVGGTTELLAWLMVLGMTTGAAETIAYVPTRTWRCGSGMVWWPQLAEPRQRRAA